MRDLLVSLLLIAAGSLSIASGAEGDVALVEGGKPAARIVVDPASPGVTKFAARELQGYVEKSTGAKLPITDASVDDGVAEVVIGAGAIAERYGVRVDKLPRDGFVIKTVGGRVFVAGRDSGPDHLVQAFWSRVPRGIEAASLFGVYEVLERFVGVRWYLPVDIGEVVPRHTDILIPTIDLVDGPDKLYRDTHMDRGCDDVAGPPPKPGHHFVPDYKTDQELAAFRKRRVRFAFRMRYGLAPAPGSHTLQHIASHTAYLDTHPDMFARSENGKHLVPPAARSAHHCFTSPELMEMVSAAAKGFFGGQDAREVGMRGWTGVGLDTPKGKVFHIAPAGAIGARRSEGL